MNEYPETIPCPPCHGDCHQGRACPVVDDGLNAARGFVYGCLIGLCIWFFGALLVVL
jgi:hypothetical protein